MNRIIANLRVLSGSNWLLTGAVLMLMLTGLLFVHSACFSAPEYAALGLARKQALWMVVGLACYLSCSMLDYHRIGRWAPLLYAVSVALLLTVLFAGSVIYGARRWLFFLGIGIQPSEVAKLACILLLASFLGTPGATVNTVPRLCRLLAFVAAPVFLILRQPDLGTAIVFVPVVFTMMLVGEVRPIYLWTLVGLGLSTVVLVLTVMFLPAKLGVSPENQTRILKTVGLSEYQRKRVETFLHPDRDPLGAGWNKTQSEIAVGSGGAFGKGYRRGTQNILGFLPRSVAPTDFIFSVIAEEMGFLGSVLVLGLFALVIGCGLHAALVADDRLGRLLCVGIVTLIFSHVFINISMTVGLAPITGIPLPILSYGGTFMVVVMTSLGLVQSVFARSQRSQEIVG